MDGLSHNDHNTLDFTSDDFIGHNSHDERPAGDGAVQAEEGQLTPSEGSDDDWL